jgi:hypothetical protein
MNTFLIIFSVAQLIIWLFIIYTFRRISRITRLKRLLHSAIPTHDDYKFIMALYTFDSIRWDDFIFKDFFKPIRIGRIITHEQSKILIGQYTAPVLTAEALKAMIMKIKYQSHGLHSSSIINADKLPEDKYEF